MIKTNGMSVQQFVVWCEDTISSLEPLLVDDVHAVQRSGQNFENKNGRSNSGVGGGSRADSTDSNTQGVKPISEMAREGQRQRSVRAYLRVSYPENVAAAWLWASRAGAPPQLLSKLSPVRPLSVEETIEVLNAAAKWARDPSKSVVGHERPENLGRPSTVIYTEELHMGNKYEAGQTIAQGENAQVLANNVQFNQLWQKSEASLDLRALSAELGDIREAMKKESKSPEQDIELGALALAEKEARAGSGPKTLEALSKVSRWTLGFAEKVGVGIAAAAIKTALGL